MAGLHFRDAAAGETDDDDATRPRDRAQAGIEYIAADILDHHVNTLLADRRIDLVAQSIANILDTGIDNVIGAGRFRRGGFFRVADGSEHGCAERFRNLYGRHADTTRRTGDQHRFAGLDVRAFNQRKMRGHIGEAHRRRFGEAHRLRNHMAVDGLRRHLLRVAAVFNLNQYTVTGFDVRDFRAHRFDHACAFLARAERQRRQHLILALDHQQVGKIDTRCLDINQRFVFTRLRAGDVFQRHAVEWAELFHHQCFHPKLRLRDYVRRAV